SSPADVCGNGILEATNNEQCDDGNTMNGDGCNATCRFEGNVVVEMEPNGRQAQANDTMLAATGTVTVSGMISPSGDDDVWSFVVPANRAVMFFARTYTLRGQPHGCDNAQTDTRIFLEQAGMEALSGPMTVELAYSDDIGGPIPSF